MNCDQLSFIFCSLPETRRFFKGCFLLENSSVFVKKILRENGPNLIALLVNVNREKVGHFVLIWKIGKNLTFFDSYGRNIDSFGPCMNKLFDRSDFVVISNTVPLQGSASCVCSLYILLVGSLLCRNFSLSQITSFFHRKDLNFNDFSVLVWFEKRTNKKLSAKFKKTLLTCSDL